MYFSPVFVWLKKPLVILSLFICPVFLGGGSCHYITGGVVKSLTDDPLGGPTVPPWLVFYSHDHTQTLAEVSIHDAWNCI